MFNICMYDCHQISSQRFIFNIMLQIDSSYRQLITIIASINYFYRRHTESYHVYILNIMYELKRLYQLYKRTPLQ